MQNRRQYMNEKEVSMITGLAVPTLRNHRHLGCGIPYIKLRRTIRYCLDDVIRYMEDHKVKTEDQDSSK